MAIIKCPECQKEVSDSAISCPHCGYGVKKHFDDIIFKEQKKARKEMLIERRKNIASMLKIAIPVLVIFVGTLTGLVINNNILSQRTTFKTKQEMLEYLTQYNNWRLDSEYIDEWLIFHKSGLGEEMNEYGLNDHGDKIVMNPKRGKFTLGVIEYIISNDGKIINNKYNDHFIPNYSTAWVESATKALKLEALSSNVNNNILEAKIKVTNQGKRTYQFINLETIAYDDSGNSIVLDDFGIVKPDNKELKSTFPPGLSEYSLAPGESGICSIHTYVEPGYNNFTTQIKEYDTWIDSEKVFENLK